MLKRLAQALRRARPSAQGCLTAAFALALAAPSLGCVGIASGITYPDEDVELSGTTLTPEGESDPSISLGEVQIKADLCKGIDTHPEVHTLAPDDLTRFLEANGQAFRVKKARGNLFWFEFPNGEDAPDDTLRLRLAVLPDAAQARDELHRSILEHGPGWWGIRRGNLAVLAPRASLSTALQFAVKRKLPCWGVMMMADSDDVYVVPGPYSEL